MSDRILNHNSITQHLQHVVELWIGTRLPSMLLCCWLGIRKSIQPVKIEWWCVGVAICQKWGADCLHMVQLMLLPCSNPVISCLIWIQTGFTFLVLAYSGSPGGPADATAIPKPRHLLPHLNSDWFFLSGTGLPTLCWKRGRWTGVVVMVWWTVTSWRRWLSHV